jgi:hypothetical protein
VGRVLRMLAGLALGAVTACHRDAPPRAETPAARPPGPEPSAAYASLGTACDLVQRAMEQRLAVTITRADSVGFENEFVRAPRTGCELKATGTFTRSARDTAPGRSADGDLAGDLSRAGWTSIDRYSADGPDGSIYGLRSGETVCIFTWSWDGGDDADSTYVPADDWQLITRCARREPGDSIADSARSGPP